MIVEGTEQISGSTANDFTYPVYYEVTADDTTMQFYTVTVFIAASTAKEITGFSFIDPAATGIINGSEIEIAVPYGTDLTNLVSTFTTTGSTVTVQGTDQTSGSTANNFSSPVVYQVTASDGSTQDYTVSVIIDLTSTLITSFSFTTENNSHLLNDIYGTIDGVYISVTVPYDTDITALKASYIVTVTIAKLTKDELMQMYLTEMM